GTVRFLPGAARAQDARLAHGAPLHVGAQDRDMARAASEGAARLLSWSAEPSAARARQETDERIWRHDLSRPRRQSRRCQTLPRALSAVRAGRKSRRRGKPDRASGADDAWLGAVRSARDARHW